MIVRQDIGGSRWRSASATALAALFVAGCGGPFDATVAGRVSFDGEPLATGTITFTPTQEGATAFGRIEEGGSYSVMTGRENGIQSGEYEVSVIAREKTQPTADGGPPPAGKMLTPQWYSSRRTSGLTVSVAPGSNTYDIELSSTPPDGWAQQGRRNRR
ncbi:MAG: hypothetical protein AAF805_01615 [Planctomycetota bacterium]